MCENYFCWYDSVKFCFLNRKIRLASVVGSDQWKLMNDKASTHSACQQYEHCRGNSRSGGGILDVIETEQFY